jgi:hypothetical protein
MSARPPLSARYLAQRFALRSTRPARAIAAIYRALHDGGASVPEVPQETHAVWAALGARWGIAAPQEPHLVAQTLAAYYATVVAAVAERLVPGARQVLDNAEFLAAVDGHTRTQLSQAAAEFEASLADQDPAWGTDLFQDFYQTLFPRRVRHALGEYYTPGWLADWVLQTTGWQGDPAQRLLDPTCGSGAFLLAALRAVRAWWERNGRPRPAQELCRQVQANVVGFDVNPLAVLTARANYLIALRDWLAADACPRPSIERRDVILTPPDDTSAGTFDFVVGNPPWIAWDHLPVHDRQATMPLWQHYGLFTLSASAARHGGGKKDLSMLLTYVAADRYLRCGGRLGFVITQTVFQSHASGDGAANWTSVLVLERGRPTVYPVPYVKWLPDGTRQSHEARPVDPQRPGSPWLLVPEGLAGLDALAGPSDYEAHLGANTGGANGVYWLEVLGADAAGLRVRNVADRGKHALASTEQHVEPELVYPLLRWGDVQRWQARPSTHLLLVQDPATRRGLDLAQLQTRCPQTYAYLRGFRALLERRAAYRRYQGAGPFYAMYNVGPYTVAPWKVVWRRMDRRLRAAVAGQCEVPRAGLRPIVPQETCVLVAVDSAEEAHYLCALLNSSLSAFLAQSSSVDGGKGFGTPGMLDHLGLRRFDPADPRHAALAQCSQRAHAAAAQGADLDAIEAEVDRLVAELAGVNAAQAGRLRAAVGR